MFDQILKSGHVFIIAEAGVNHNGDMRLAKKLVDAAKSSGANAVKFQSFKANQLASKEAPKAEYQLVTTAEQESQFDMLKRLELTSEDHYLLRDYCCEQEIEFISSPFDEGSIEELFLLGVRMIKVPSGEIVNHPYLEVLASKNIPVILSTGMSTMQEVKEAVSIFEKYQNKQLALLHCVTEYPCPYSELNLKAMQALKEFGLPVGFSDHTQGVEAAIAAVAMGAQIIEKHITLDQSMDGPDHKASANIPEFQYMVKAIRNIEVAMGDGIKRPAPCEEKNMSVVRKSIMAARTIESGVQIEREDIIFNRPGSGIYPKFVNDVLGKHSNRRISVGEQIQWKDLV